MTTVLESVVTNPLSCLGVRTVRAPRPAGELSSPAVRPLALQVLAPAPHWNIPAYLYDPERQLAVGFDGQPLAPSLEKDWTTVAGTHTDGDGGDNETWGWEEVVAS